MTKDSTSTGISGNTTSSTTSENNIFDIDTNPTTTTKKNITINVRNAEDPLLTIEMPITERVEQLKYRILEEKKKLGCRIRLIYNGKMLLDQQTLADAKLIDNCFIISSITVPLDLNLNQPTYASLPNQSTSNNILTGVTDHVNIIPSPFQGTNNNDVSASPLSTSASPSTNSSVHNNIQELLRQHQAQLDNDFIMEMESTNGLTINHVTPEVEGGSGRGRMFRDVGARDSLELFLGMAFGFLVGPIALFWLSRDYMARQIKIGIVAGVMFNMVVGLTKVSSSGGGGAQKIA